MRADEDDMHQQVKRQSVLARVRTERVVRRIERGRFGETTRNYNRNQRVQHLAFNVLVGVTIVLGVVIAVV